MFSSAEEILVLNLAHVGISANYYPGSNLVVRRLPAPQHLLDFKIRDWRHKIPRETLVVANDYPTRGVVDSHCERSSRDD